MGRLVAGLPVVTVPGAVILGIPVLHRLRIHWHPLPARGGEEYDRIAAGAAGDAIGGAVAHFFGPRGFGLLGFSTSLTTAKESGNCSLSRRQVIVATYSSPLISPQIC